MTRRALLLLLAAIGVARPARAQNVPDLKAAPDTDVVQRADYCQGMYRLTFRDGSVRELMEFNLRMKTDSGSRGPAPGRPVMLTSGMGGDRFFLIFSAPEEISAFFNRC